MSLLFGGRDGEIKDKLIIKAKEASNSAIEKIKKAGGEIVLSKINLLERFPNKKIKIR